MLATMRSSTVIGIDAVIVDVEVDIAHGLPAFTVVGLPDAAVKESRERVKSAVQNSGYRFPDDRITVNLAPANIKKDGTGFDVPMALGILAAADAFNPAATAEFLMLGELSLDGRIKPVRGCLPMALAARSNGYSGIIVPGENGREAAIVEGLTVLPVRTLAEVVEYFRGISPISPLTVSIDQLFDAPNPADADMADVMGQTQAKRALEITAAGGHNLLLIGPPGSGKTMLARRLPTILPPLTFREAMETTAVYSVTGMLGPDQALITRRPFRAPHHTISDAGLVGGGHIPRPGEVSLAHNGVLFLDELPEYKKHVLEVLRQPLEDARVTLARAATTLTYPASVTLIAAMNPCPCGFLGDARHRCRCALSQVHRYRSKVSGPLLDRIDLHVEVPAVAYRELRGDSPGEPSENIRQRVMAARQRQLHRFRRSALVCNAQMSSRQIRVCCRLDTHGERLLESAVERLGLSARAHSRILKIARTIADLAGAEAVAADHVGEAIQYRNLDRGRHNSAHLGTPPQI